MLKVGVFVAIKTTLTNSERDDLTKDVDDLDKVYIEKMQAEGMDPDLLAQFKELTLTCKQSTEKE